MSDSDRIDGGSPNPDRVAELKAAVVVLGNSMNDFRVIVGLDEHYKPCLCIEISLDEAGAEAAKTIFHGSPDAHRVNGENFILGGLMATGAAIKSAETGKKGALKHVLFEGNWEEALLP